MQQALFLLKMNALELNDYLKQAVTDNPVLELAEAKLAQENEVFRLKRDGKVVRMAAGTSGQEGSEVAAKQTLTEDLLRQLGLKKLGNTDKRIAMAIIYSLDTKGYFTEDYDEFALGYATSPEQVKKSLRIVQSLDPAGIGARNVKECLILQLKRQGVKQPQPYAIIRSHLRDLAQDKKERIAAALKIPEKECEKYCNMVRSLWPAVNGIKAGELVQYVHPEIVIEKDGNTLAIRFAEERLPHLSINPEYRGMENADDEAKAYLKERYLEANRMISSLKLWKTMIRRVMERIAEKQEGFFLKNEALRPMKLSDLAGELDVSVSTISRAVAGKYLICERGVYPLKYFFVRSFQANEAQVSSDYIREAILEMLEKEPTLPDTELARRLKERGIGIARRTVAKYRNKMGIESVYHRVKIL